MDTHKIKDTTIEILIPLLIFFILSQAAFELVLSILSTYETIGEEYILRVTISSVISLLFVLTYISMTDVLKNIHKPSISKSTLKFSLYLGFCLLILNIIFTIIIRTFGIESSSNVLITQGLSDPTFYLLMIPISILLIGPLEELVFRGLIQGSVRNQFSTNTGIIIASLIFGVSHITSLSGSLSVSVVPYIISTFILGLVLGKVYEYYKNIVIPVVGHGVYNSLLFIIQYLSVTGL
jgi:hypothetical protein